MFFFYPLAKTNYFFAITKHNIRDECPKYLRNRFIYIMHMNRCINASRNTNTMRQNQETYWISKRETPVKMIFLVRCNNACKLQCTLHRVNTIHWYQQWALSSFFSWSPFTKDVDDDAVPHKGKETILLRHHVEPAALWWPLDFSLWFWRCTGFLYIVSTHSRNTLLGYVAPISLD